MTHAEQEMLPLLGHVFLFPLLRDPHLVRSICMFLSLTVLSHDLVFLYPCIGAKTHNYLHAHLPIITRFVWVRL